MQNNGDKSWNNNNNNGGNNNGNKINNVKVEGATRAQWPRRTLLSPCPAHRAAKGSEKKNLKLSPPFTLFQMKKKKLAGNNKVFDFDNKKITVNKDMPDNQIIVNRDGRVPGGGDRGYNSWNRPQFYR